MGPLGNRETQSQNSSWAELPLPSQCCLTWGWRGWSSGSGRCWRICDTAAWPKGSTAQSSLTQAFPPPPRAPLSLSSPPSAAPSPSTPQTVHCHGYHRTQRPGTTLTKTPPCLPPSDWQQARKQWEKLQEFEGICNKNRASQSSCITACCASSFEQNTTWISSHSVLKPLLVSLSGRYQLPWVHCRQHCNTKQIHWSLKPYLIVPALQKTLKGQLQL